MKHTLTPPPHRIGLLTPSCPVRPLAVGCLRYARIGAWLFAAALALGAHAQEFDSGSNGSYGALEITANTTLEMPPDGVFHCTTITITNGATLRFTPNARTRYCQRASACAKVGGVARTQTATSSSPSGMFRFMPAGLKSSRAPGGSGRGVPSGFHQSLFSAGLRVTATTSQATP